MAALNAAGITSYADLGAATSERLAGIVQEQGVRGGDFGAWIVEAQTHAAGKHATRAKQAESCPQDLSAVDGIGASNEQKLYAAGIGTYWQLANVADDRLGEILAVKDFQSVDFETIRTDARRLAEESGTVERTWDGTPPDDFEVFEGIGEVYEGRLYNAGICTYRALAGATVEQLAQVCKAPAWRLPDYAAWIAQAKVLLAQRGR